MTNYQYFKIFTSIFLLWLFTLIPENTTTIISYFSVMSIGIVHGSNDLYILRNLNSKKKSLGLFLGSYLLIIFFCIVIFLYWKTIAFLLFILLSSYHFGEQHLNKNGITSPYLKFSTYLFHGFFIFSLLFINQQEEVVKISSELFALQLNGKIFYYFLVCSGLFYFTALLFHAKEKGAFNDVFEELVYSLFFFIFFKATSLIVGFSLYFIIWHSIPSIQDQTVFLHNKITRATLRSYFQKSALLWTLSILFVSLIYWFFRDSYFFDSIIFGILFAISAPHIFVILFMNLTQRKNLKSFSSK